MMLNGVFHHWNRNLVNSVNLIKSMKHEMGRPCLLPVCLDGCVETSWSLTQQVAGSNKHFYKNIFIELNKFTEYIGKTQMTQHNDRPQRSCEGYVFTGVCLSTGGVCIPACIAGGIPACLAAGLQGDVYPSMHCRRYPNMPLSRPTPKGEIEGDQVQAHTQGGNGGGSGPGPHPRGKWRGIRSRPTPKGEMEGDQVQAHTQGGNGGGSDPGLPPPHCMVGCTLPQSRHPPWKQTPPGSRPPQSRHPPGADTPLGTDTPWEQTSPGSRHSPGADPPLQETTTAADGTHPTGMHSCL